MHIYLAKRLLFFIPVIFCIVLLSFILLHYSPGDPVERMLNQHSEETVAVETNRAEIELLRKKLGLDLPLFYFSVTSLNEDPEPGQGWKKYIPAVRFHAKNQFHRWLTGDDYQSGLLQGDLGRSWLTSEGVSSILLPKLSWSLLLTLSSIFLAYMISIPFGIKAAANPESAGVRTTQKLFIILFSLPAFWVASLLMLLFCNPQVMNFLPASGVGPAGGFDEGDGIISRAIQTIPYLILPTICYTYSSLAFLSNNVKVSIMNVLSEDYIRTARAKGLSEKRVIYVHSLRNALLPMITIFAGVFPVAIGGSVILETVFSIPGMGLLIYNSIAARDYPVVVSVFMLTALVTVTSFLISDILYAMADPRISFTSKR